MIWDDKTDAVVRLTLSLVGFFVWTGGCAALLTAFLYPPITLPVRVFLCVTGTGFTVLGGMLCIAVLLTFYDQGYTYTSEIQHSSPMVRVAPVLRYPPPAVVATGATDSSTRVLPSLRVYTRPSSIAPEIPPDAPLVLQEFEGSV